MDGSPLQLPSRLAAAEVLDGVDRATALIRIATDMAIHEPRRALELVQRARAGADAAPQAEIDHAEGLCRYYLGETHEAITLALAASSGFEATGEEAMRSEALSLLADACNRIGRLSSAAEAGVLALECAQRADNLPAVAWAICALGNTMLQRGEHRHAADLYAASRDAFAACGDTVGESWMTANLGEALCRAGDLDRGLAALEQSLRLVEREAPATAGLVRIMLADGYAEAERLEDALEHAEQGVTWARSRGSRDDEGYALSASGSTLVALGRSDEARDRLTAALEIGVDAENVEVRLRALVGLGSLHVAEGSEPAAAARLEEAVELAEASGNRAMAVRAGRALADLHARAQRYEEAYRALRLALEEQCRTAPEDDLLHEVVEQYLGRFGPRAGITLICASCKSVHDTLADHWRPVEGFLSRALEVQLSHGLCPSCFTEEMRAIT